MLGDERDEYEDPPRPFWRRALMPAAAIGIMVVGGFLLFRLLHTSGPSPRPHHETKIVNVKLPPPPPPPPPPKTPPPPTRQQAKQAPSRVPHPTPVKAPPKAPTPPAAATTSIQGNGPGALASGNGGGGDCIGEGCGSGDGGGGDAGAYYKTLISNAVEQALERDARTRGSHYSGMVALLFDRSGRVISVRIVDFDGDSDTRAAIARVLQTVSAGENLPADMTDGGNPFTLRIRAHARG